ncbi:hypothetical protein ONZ45_g11773 [Pleurotus djamor]|nr:hypothetical protein ONZ45_g11773 [Pleurotus djamor]
MATTKAEYVIFDMDGLMIDSERVYTDVTNEILSKYGKEMTWDMKAGCMGKPERDAAAHLLSFFPEVPLTTEDYLKQRNELQDLRWPHVQLMPGVSRLIKHLHAHKVPIAVATGSRRRNFDLKTQHLGEVFDCFDGKILCADDPVQTPTRKMKGKPSPDIFIWAAKMLLGKDVGDPDVQPDANETAERQKGLVFEDALPGMQAGKRAGMTVVWVPDSNLLNVEYDGSERADITLKSLEDFIPEQMISLQHTGTELTIDPLPPWLDKATQSTNSATQDQLHSAQLASAALQQSINLIKDELHAIDDYLVMLRDTERQIEWELDQYQCVLAPIRRLPHEILSTIFTACVSNDMDVLCNPVDQREPPRVLGRVCRLWRSIVDSTPAIWSRIRLELRNLSPLDTSSLHTIGKFFQKTGNHPIRLSVDFSHYVSHPAIDIVIAHATQWQEVSLTLMNTSTWATLSSIRYNLPLLRHLRLQLGYTWRNSSSPLPSHLSYPIDIFAHASALRSLEMEPYERLSLPWHQIRQLTANFENIADVWQLLADANNAVEYDLCSSITPPITPPPHEEIKLPFAKSLTLRYSYRILQYLNMPLIEELWVADVENPDPDTDWSVNPSFCSPRTIGFMMMHTDHYLAIRYLLSMVPSPVTLTCDMGSAYVVLPALLPPRRTRHRQRAVLPKLQHIILSGRGTWGTGHLVEVLQTRRKSSHASTTLLQTLTFTRTDLTIPQITRLLTPWDSGLGVSCNGVWIEESFVTSTDEEEYPGDASSLTT